MPTLAEAIATFCKVERATTTNDLYRRVLSRLSTSLGPDRDVARLTYEDLLDFMDTLKRSGLSDISRKNYCTFIKAFCNWCVSRKYLADSPARDLYVRVAGENPAISRAVPPEDLQKMLDFVKFDRRNYALLLFLIDTGCRVGGLRSLTLSNLDLAGGSAWLLEKGAKWCQVFFGTETTAALQHWLERRPTAGHEYVWTADAPAYQVLSVAGIQAVIRRAAKESGCSEIWSPHDIRHSVGHAWAKAGLPATVIQRKLNHENVKTTLDYYMPHDTRYVEELSRRHQLLALRGPEEPPVALPPMRVIPKPRRVK